MANVQALTMRVGVKIDKWVTDLTQESDISWSCGTVQTLCHRHSKLMSLEVHAHGVSRMSLTCFSCV